MADEDEEQGKKIGNKAGQGPAPHQGTFFGKDEGQVQQRRGDEGHGRRPYAGEHVGRVHVKQGSGGQGDKDAKKGKALAGPAPGPKAKYPDADGQVQDADEVGQPKLCDPGACWPRLQNHRDVQQARAISRFKRQRYLLAHRRVLQKAINVAAVRHRLAVNRHQPRQRILRKVGVPRFAVHIADDQGVFKEGAQKRLLHPAPRDHRHRQFNGDGDRDQQRRRTHRSNA